MTNTQTETEAVLSEMTPETMERLVQALGETRAQLRRELRRVTDQLQERSVQLVQVLGEGHEARIARLAGVDRMTLRTWQGKPRITKE